MHNKHKIVNKNNISINEYFGNNIGLHYYT